MTLDGDKYSNATVKRIEPDGIIVADADGVRKLKFKNLPPEEAKKYGYDPQKEAQFKAEEAEKNLNIKQAAELKQLQEAQALKATQIKQTEAEAALKKVRALEQQKKEAQAAVDKYMPEKGGVGKIGSQILKVEGVVGQILPQGFLLASGWSNYVVITYIDERGISHSGGDVGEPEPLYIIGPHGNLVDGDAFSGLIYPAGIYSYGSIIGANKTVRCYATTFEAAEKFRAQHSN